MYRGELLNHLVVYEIPDEIRRRVIVKCLDSCGTRIVYDEPFKSEMKRQYGPYREPDGQYETLLARERFEEMLEFLTRAINPLEDRLRLYLLNAVDHEGEHGAIRLGLAAGEEDPPVDALYA
jgi:CRISPR/Cas system-associated endoribonuclease Cas2